MKKSILLLLLLALTSCGSKNGTTKARTSDLKGTFTYNEAINTQYKRNVDDGNYLYCSIYPQTGIVDGEKFLYQIDQRLKLNKDYSYNYEYSITLGNPGDWGNLQLAMLHINISGTFTYTKDKNSENKFIVNLSNPTSGIEEIYGTYLNNPTSYWQWEMHEEPDYVLDFSSLSKIENYSYDEYSCGRKVIVSKASSQEEKNTIEDNLFFRYILETFAHFSTY